jgi:hypothetical protein
MHSDGRCTCVGLPRHEGSIPASISQLAKLSLLDLANNNFSGAITEPLAELRSLVQLNLADNAFGGTVPPNFGQMLRLKEL